MSRILQKGIVTSSLIIFLVGGLGGVFLNRFFIPILGEVWPFSAIFPPERVESGVTVINKKEEITVQENIALEKAIKKVIASVVKVEVESRGEILKEGTGILVTNDGLVLVPYDLVKLGTLYVQVGEIRHEAKIFKFDTERNIATLMVKNGRFPTASFGDIAKRKLGERVFLLGIEAGEAGSYPFVVEGAIKSLQENSFQVSMFDSSAHGAPIFNIEGEFIGMSQVTGKDLFVLPSSVIRSFLGF